jgi:hypothetical protein
MLFGGLSLAFVGLSTFVGCAPQAVEEEPVDALDSALAQEDFDATVQHLTALPWLPWAYTTDGCYARALYYSMLLATKGVPTNHLYVIALPGAPPLGGIWAWHVAPSVTKDGDPNHVYVLDPVYDQTKALTNVEWVAHQGYADPASSRYPSLHIHPGNSYLDQFNRRTPLVNPAEPDASHYKEPTFAAMPAFEMDDVSHACQVMHRYIDWEPGSSNDVRSEKHRSLARETQRLVAQLATKGKLNGDPSELTASCTRGETLNEQPNGGGPESDEVLEGFNEPTRILQSN